MSPARSGQRSATSRGKRAFATTWWGQAWVAALEDSTLDAGRLSRGRTYARKGMVGDITVAPGRIKAPDPVAALAAAWEKRPRTA